MKWERACPSWLKGPLARFGLWIIRTLIREGKEELAKFAVDGVLNDDKIPTNNVGSFVRKNFSVRTGRRGF